MSQYLDLTSLLDKKSQIKKIFFYRVCGTGIACACLLREAGFEVHGAIGSFPSHERFS